MQLAVPSGGSRPPGALAEGSSVQALIPCHFLPSFQQHFQRGEFLWIFPHFIFSVLIVTRFVSLIFVSLLYRLVMLLT